MKKEDYLKANRLQKTIGDLSKYSVDEYPELEITDIRIRVKNTKSSTSRDIDISSEVPPTIEWVDNKSISDECLHEITNMANIASKMILGRINSEYHKNIDEFEKI